MATVYSLICFGGRDGKTVTFTDAGDVVNLTNHGLRNGTGVVFTTSGTLPTGITSGTTYYSKEGADTGKFTIWTTSGLTTQVTFTGTGSGTHTVKLAERNALTTDQKLRYGTAGSERIYDGIVAWNSGRSGASAYDYEVCEILHDWYDAITSQLTLNVPSAACLITPTVNGVRTSAWHGGVWGAGYMIDRTTTDNNPCLYMSKYRQRIEGVSLRISGAGYNPPGIYLAAAYCGADNMIMIGRSDKTPGSAITMGQIATTARNNVCYGWNVGIAINQYLAAVLVANNTCCGNAYGVYPQNANVQGFYYNNIAVGNTTNWGTQPTGMEAAAYNGGLVGEAWGSATRFTIATTDFLDYANNIYSPALVTSPQVEAVVSDYYDSYAQDIADDVRPNYVGSLYNTAITAGSFVSGLRYTIASIGSTDFTACGASTNAVTFTDAGDTVGWTAHSLSNGNLIYFSVITTTTGISINTAYYVVGSAANTFQVSLTLGGSAIALTTNGTGTVVLPTFKATGAGTGTGAAKLNAKYDAGAFEWDHGNGLAPNTVTVAGSGMIDGTRVKIAKQSDGTEYRNVVLSGATTDSFSQDAPANISVYIYLRKGSATPYYKPVKLSATILADGGLTYDATGLQVEDIAAATYAAGVATDWTIDTGTGAIVHASGSTRYSVQDLYSFHQNYTDDSATVDDAPLMDGITPTVFNLINTGTITDSDLEDLYGGSIEFPNGTLWANVYHAGSLTGTPDIYLVQNGSKVTSFWTAGTLDVLVKVAIAGVLTDSGLVTAYARKYGYSYSHHEVNAASGGRNVAPLSTLSDATTQAISAATAATYTGVTYTFSTTSHDLGEGGGSASYRCVVDCGGLTLDKVYARLMYDCRDVSAATINGAAGWQYQKANSAYTANAAAPFGTYAGGFWTVAQGVWLSNVASEDTYNYVLTDHAGVTHQLTQPSGAATATLASGSRIVLYNTTQDVEIDNAAASGAYSYTITTEAATNDVLTLYYFKEGYEEGSSTMIWSGTTQAFVVTQTVDASVASLRTELGITDYTTISEFVLDVTGTVEIDADDADGNTQKARFAIWYNGILTTENGARYLRGVLTILSTAAFRINVDVYDLKFENISVTYGLNFTDTERRLWRSDGTPIYAAASAAGSIQNDYSGVPDTVETGVSGLTGSESAQLMGLPSASATATAVLSAASTTPIQSDIRKVNNTTVTGNGETGTEWGPA